MKSFCGIGVAVIEIGSNFVKLATTNVLFTNKIIQQAHLTNNMDFGAELNDFFTNHYQENSLAYLGLSAKVENPFRDQFAFFLHKKYPDDFVSREYSNGGNQRVDLAVINEGKGSKEFIEIKACYAFDLINHLEEQYKRQILTDYSKYPTEKIANITFILLSIRTDNCPSDKYKTIVKYYNKMSKCHKKIHSTDEQRTRLMANIQRWFANEHRVKLWLSETKNLGQAFGVNVYLDYFILKKLS